MLRKSKQGLRVVRTDSFGPVARADLGTRFSRFASIGIVPALVAAAALVGGPAAHANPAGAAQVQSCQLGVDGLNPCPSASDSPKGDVQLCDLGYGPNGLQCVDEPGSGGPDDLKSCEPDKQNPDVNPCQKGSEEGPGEGGEDSGEGGEDPGDVNDEPYDGEGTGKENVVGGIPIPNRVDTGAGGATKAGGQWLLLAATALMLLAATVVSAEMATRVAIRRVNR